MRSTRLPAESSAGVPGWPRPHYLSETDPEKTVRYAQWTAETMDSQVLACSSDRTYTAGVHNLCSCCAAQVERGLLLDFAWVNANRPDGYEAELDEHHRTAVGHGQLDRSDVAYGSPLCYRCAVFALRHCPLFSALDACFGDSLAWVLVTAADQYQEFDETSAIAPLHPYVMPRTSTGEVRKHLRLGRRWLLGRSAADLPVLSRTYDEPDETGHLASKPVPKMSAEQVSALPRTRGWAA